MRSLSLFALVSSVTALAPQEGRAHPAVVSAVSHLLMNFETTTTDAPATRRSLRFGNKLASKAGKAVAAVVAPPPPPPCSVQKKKFEQMKETSAEDEVVAVFTKAHSPTSNVSKINLINKCTSVCKPQHACICQILKSDKVSKELDSLKSASQSKASSGSSAKAAKAITATKTAIKASCIPIAGAALFGKVCNKACTEIVHFLPTDKLNTLFGEAKMKISAAKTTKVGGIVTKVGGMVKDLGATMNLGITA